MIDNRPKKHRVRKPVDTRPVYPPDKPETIHSGGESHAPAKAEEPSVRVKSVPASPLAGIGAGIGNLGNLGVLPVILLVSALNRGKGQPALPPAPAVASASVQAAPAAAAEQPAAQAETGRKRHSLRAYRKQPEPEPEPVPEPVQQAAPPQPRPARPQPRPQEIRNLLNDLSGYLPGAGNSNVARISKIIGIAEELRSIDGGGGVFAASAPANPMDRNIGLLNALSRNMPNTGASNLGRASQVLSLVNTLKGTGGGGLGNLTNMAGMLGGMMNQNQNQGQQEMKNVTPSQAEGIKDTVNKLLSGMDEKKKSELLSKAKDFLGKAK